MLVGGSLLPYSSPENPDQYFIGIDASARSTGVVIASLEGDTKEYLLVPKNLKGPARLKNLYLGLMDCVSGIKIERAAIEGPSYNSANKPFTLGEVYGVFKLLLEIRGVPVHVVSPRSVKKYATGKGSATKEEVLLRAKAMGCVSDSNDVADAWFIAMIAKDAHLGYSTIRTRKSQEVINAVMKKGPE